MKKTRLIGALCALTLTASVLATGCQPPKSDKLSVGKVDTAILLQDDSDYQSLSIEYMKENTDLREKFVKQFKGVSNDQKPGIQNAYKEAQKKLDGKWMGKTQNFLESRHGQIKVAAEGIAQRKAIDIVIIDSKAYPTVEWGGVDITQDMQLDLSQGGGGPAATASPKKGV